MLSTVSSWNSRARFHVILLNTGNEYRTVIKQILANFWKYFVINIVVNVVADETSSDTKIFTWMPFEKRNCGQNTSDFFEVGSCSNSMVETGDANLFPDKVS